MKGGAARVLTVKDMTTEEEQAQIQDERDEARQGLRDTLAEVNAKVERARYGLRPDHLIETHPAAACLAAGALGFFLGANENHQGVGRLMLAAILGFALLKRSSLDEGGDDVG